MKTLYRISIAILFCTSQFVAMAQTDSASHVQFKFGLFHNTRLNYYGRTDSLQSSGSFPLMELWFSNHVYINAAPVFVHNAKANFQYAGTVATMGYQFNDLKKWAGNFYIVKPFYKSNSQLVQSALKAQAAATLTLKSKLINITGGGDLKFSDKTDIGLTAGLDHPFRFQLNSKTVMVLDPSGYVNAGTQQFVNTYYKKTNFLLLPGPSQEVSENSTRLNLLSYELSIPVILASGKMQFLFLPAYVIPKNLNTAEKGDNMFYATIGVKTVI